MRSGEDDPDAPEYFSPNETSSTATRGHRHSVWPECQELQRLRKRPDAKGSTARGGPTMVGGTPRFEEAAVMYVRAVRFTDVSAERMQELLARIEESDGPPPGVPATGLKVLFDEAQGTAVVLQRFESAEDMEAGGKVFSAMDSSDTPGARASVDMCEVKLERTLT
jgi:hypothetical protein